MHWTLAVTCVLVAWAIVAGPWRLGSVALAASWMIAQTWFYCTGEAVPVKLYYLLDVYSIAVLILWRTTWSDWLIVALYPVEWYVYENLAGVDQWWILWALSGVQLMLAGPWAQVQRTLHTVSHGPLRPGVATDRRIG